MLKKKKEKQIIKSAFRLVPCYPGDFDLIGFKIGEMYYIDKYMRYMIYEMHEMFDIMFHFWTFLNSFPMVCSGSTWITKFRSGHAFSRQLYLATAKAKKPHH